MKHSVEEITLKNGIKGLLVNVPDASVMTYDLSFRAGDYLVDPEKWEIPHAMEHVLLGANQMYKTSREFQAELEKNGAYANASTGSYDITYEAECADFEWDRVLALLLTAISKPLFLKNEFEAEMGNIREELFSRSNNHFRHLNLALREKYGYHVLTDQERLKRLKNVKLEDVRKHYKLTHRTPNMRFVVAGNITDARREMLTKMLEVIDLPSDGVRTALPVEKPKTLSKALYIENKSVENIYFYIDTFMNRRATESEIYALSLLNVMLTETLHSRIFGTAREKGLVYGVGSNYTRYLNATNFWIGAQVMTTNTEKLFKIIKKEMRDVVRGKIKDEDIRAAKLYSLGKYQRGAQTVSGTANLYTGRYFYEEEYEDYERIPDKIQAVTKEQIQAVVMELYSENVKGFGVLGSCGDDFAQEAFKSIDELWASSS